MQYAVPKMNMSFRKVNMPFPKVKRSFHGVICLSQKYSRLAKMRRCHSEKDSDHFQRRSCSPDSGEGFKPPANPCHFAAPSAALRINWRRNPGRDRWQTSMRGISRRSSSKWHANVAAKPVRHGVK
jgi:hypothetical protein